MNGVTKFSATSRTEDLSQPRLKYGSSLDGYLHYINAAIGIYFDARRSLYIGCARILFYSKFNGMPRNVLRCSFKHEYTHKWNLVSEDCY